MACLSLVFFKLKKRKVVKNTPLEWMDRTDQNFQPSQEKSQAPVRLSHRSGRKFWKTSTLRYALNMQNKATSTEIKTNIKTPQELVHIKHKITLRQYKYWLLMLRAYRDAHETGKPPNAMGFYQISLATIELFLGYEPVKNDLRDDLTAIRREEIVYNVLCKDGRQIMRGAGFISEWEISSSWIGFKLPDFLRESVEQLDIQGSIFHALNWSVFNSFTGKYEAILYKLCKDYVGVGRTPVISTEEFREYMGVKPNEYVEFKDLNKYVINFSIASINASEISDITIEVQFTREMRKIVQMQFLVYKKQQLVLDMCDDPAFQLAKVSISLAQQKAYLAIRPPELIALALERANTYGEVKESQGDEVNYGALYRRAINEDWGTEQLTKKMVGDEKQKASTVKFIDEKMILENDRIEKLEKLFYQEARSAVIKSLSRSEMDEKMSAYKATGGSIESYKPEEGRFKDSLEGANFKNWLRVNVKFDTSLVAFEAWQKERAKERL